MIRYTLRCSQGHTFDEWFASIGAFEEQRDGESLRCPECGDTRVHKPIAAPAVNSSGRQAEPEPATCGAPGCGGGMCGMP